MGDLGSLNLFAQRDTGWGVLTARARLALGGAIDALRPDAAPLGSEP